MSKDRREIAKSNNPLADAHAQVYSDENAQRPKTSETFQKLMKEKAIQNAVQQGNAIVSVQQGMIEIRGCQMTPTGLNIPASASSDDLQFVASVINQLEGALQWMIGDIVAFSENMGYGDVSALAEWFNKAPQTLSNWGSISRFFHDTSRRRPGLSFSHHAEVIGHDDADTLLQKAEADRWSVSRLRLEVNGRIETQKLPAWEKRIQSLSIDLDPKRLKKLDKPSRARVRNFAEALLKALDSLENSD